MQYFAGNLKLGEGDTPGSESWSIKVRRRARTLMKTLDTGYMEMGEILYTVWNTPLNGDSSQQPVFRAWGFKTFADYAETELKLHRRKAERLRRLFADLSDLTEDGLDSKLRKRIVELGWSKVREITRVLNVENAEQWTDMAENLSYPELMVAISKALESQQGSGDDEEKKPSPVGKPADYKELKRKTFHVFPGQEETIDEALKRAQQVTKSIRTGHNLEMICTDYLATNDFRLKDDPKAALRYIAKIERLTGKRFVVVDPETLDVEYGIGVLEDMAKEED